MNNDTWHDLCHDKHNFYHFTITTISSHGRQTFLLPLIFSEKAYATNNRYRNADTLHDLTIELLNFLSSGVSTSGTTAMIFIFSPPHKRGQLLPGKAKKLVKSQKKSGMLHASHISFCPKFPWEKRRAPYSNIQGLAYIFPSSPLIPTTFECA